MKIRNRFIGKTLTCLLPIMFCLCGAVSADVPIGDSPPEAVGRPAPPNFMIILDDSGSMAWSTLNRGSSEGKFFVGSDPYTDIYSSSLQRYWRSKWCGPGKNTTNAPNPSTSSNYNALAYNPKIQYKPWYGMGNASVSTPKKHPNGETTWNITSEHFKINGISVKRSHYYRWSESAQKGYLVNLSGSIAYYEIDGDKNGYIGDTEIASATPTSDVVIKRDTNDDGTEETVTYAQEIQNFANWYQYHRTRWLAAVGAITHMVSRFNGVMVGINTIWQRVNVPVKAVRIKNDLGVVVDESSLITDPITSSSAEVADGTPLRRALYRVGQYYDQTDGSANGGIGTSPIATEANGGACQQNYAMLFTDGFRNTDSNSDVTAVGNADNATSLFSGVSPYKDSYSYTLADVAMHFYKKDLSTIPNKVPENGPDKAVHQHMVTYTVGFGLDGQLVRSNYDISSSDTNKHPVWPEPVASTLTTIDDLWHAAVNGRGDYISANDSKELEEAFSQVAEEVSQRAASAASVALNGTDVNEGLMIYQSRYNTSGWAGNMLARKYPNVEGVEPATPDFTKTPLQVWNAAQKLSTRAYTDRKIMTYNGTSGIPFRTFTSLSTVQQTQLVSQDVLNYIRGDHSKEQRNGGLFRNRLVNDEVLGSYESKLGDIVHSAPAFADGVVYVGANDGMLHAFRGEAAGGDELFAYVPNLVFANLKDLSSTSYSHKYYVDHTPFVKKVGSEYYLVSGLGKGGKGIFCLNVTNAKSDSLTESSASSIVKWEYPSTPGSDPNMGYSYSKPFIVNTKAAGWVVIFGNGYNSSNQKAVLYIRKLSDGSEVKTIDTGVAGDNGLSTPNVVDVNADGFADYVYAGDLKGNLWKFDIRSTSTGDWNLAYGNNPLFTAKGSDGQSQPITSRPDAMLHCEAGLPGYMVVFGTGKLLDGLTDNVDVSKQAVYGIWDYGDDADDTEYVGPLGAWGSESASLNYLSPVSLLRQSVEWSGSATAEGEGEMYDEVLVMTANPIVWAVQNDTEGQKPNPAGGGHAGWCFEFPHSRERIVNDIIIRNGNAIIVSTIPAVGSTDPCSPNGESWLYVLDACSGGRPSKGVYDLNNNGKVNSEDKITTPGGSQYPTGLHYSKMMYSPAFAEGDSADLDVMFLGSEGGSVGTVETPPPVKGIFYWRSY